MLPFITSEDLSRDPVVGSYRGTICIDGHQFDVRVAADICLSESLKLANEALFFLVTRFDAIEDFVRNVTIPTSAHLLPVGITCEVAGQRLIAHLKQMGIPEPQTIVVRTWGTVLLIDPPGWWEAGAVEICFNPGGELVHVDWLAL